jgi:hypothetical protein
MKNACLTWLGLYVVLALGLAAWFLLHFPVSPTVPPSLPDAPFRMKVALGAGFLDALPALFALSMLSSGWARVRERQQLARAAEGGFPAEGERGVFHGPIHRDGPPLTAPLSGRDCLLYRYEMSHIASRNRFGTNRTSDVSITDTIVDAEGFALTPSTIQTANGPVKLLTLVKPEFKADRFSREAISANYAAYVATTTLSGTGSVEMHPSLLRSLLRDADGAIRYDLGTGTLDPSVAYVIKEHIVQHGDDVAVFGKHSAARGGIVCDPDSMMVMDTRLRKGSLDSLKGGLLRNAIGYVLGSVAWGLVAAAGAWVFFTFGPSHIWD